MFTNQIFKINKNLWKNRKRKKQKKRSCSCLPLLVHICPHYLLSTCPSKLVLGHKHFNSHCPTVPFLAPSVVSGHVHFDLVITWSFQTLLQHQKSRRYLGRDMGQSKYCLVAFDHLETVVLSTSSCF